MNLKPWALYALSVVCFAIVFRTHSLGVALPCLLVALVAMVWATLMLAQARIESRAQDTSTLLGPEELARIRAKLQAERQASEAAARPAPEQG
jgi:choline-glycine betaine transporter